MQGLNILLQTTFPIFFLMIMGLISRKMDILKEGDERVLSAYLYYFAMPALILVDLPEIVFTKETYRFIIIGTLPIIIALAIFLLIYYIFRIRKETFYLVAIGTIYGNTAFYGLPFITFAFPTKQAELLATLTISSISIIIFIFSVILLEFYRLENISIIFGLKLIIKRMLTNPLILCVLLGVVLLITGSKIPLSIATPLNMIGGTTSTVAIFMLGVLMYGKKLHNIFETIKLSLLRSIFLPILSILILTLFNLNSLESSIIVLNNAMPLGISITVLSDQYNFYKETMVTLLLISSIMAGIYLNLWLIFVVNFFK